jgi:hypothetical protein
MISKKVDVKQVEKEVPRDLEEIAAKLLQAARKLPPGPDRQSIVKEIGKFRARIAALMAKAN